MDSVENSLLLELLSENSIFFWTFYGLAVLLKKILPKSRDLGLDFYDYFLGGTFR